jgi:hypothetical protein
MLQPLKLLALLLLLPAMSCTAPIELKTIDSEPVIVVFGYLVEGETHQTVRLSSSSPYFAEKDNRPVSDAAVTLFTSDGQTYEMEEVIKGQGYYQTREVTAAVPGITYRLHIEVDFDRDGLPETYEAETSMPPPFPLDSITIEPIMQMGFRLYSVNFYGLDSPEEDSYLLRYILNDTLVDYQLSSYRILSDIAFNNSYVDGFPVMFLDDIANKEIAGVDHGEVYVKQGDKITVCVSRIEKGFAEFVRQCRSEKQGENPFFGGPASNITTNITNGGVGYFTAFTTSMTDAYVP